MEEKRITIFSISLVLLMSFGLSGCQEANHKTYIFGNRIPNNFFITWGKGESEVTVHAGSFDDALRMAQIQDYNIITYSSILPPEAEEVSVPKVMHHGAVLESIMAEVSGKKGETLTAGLIIWKVRNKSNGQVIGGFVAEYHGNEPKEIAEENLRLAMEGMFDRRFGKEEYETYDTRLIVKSFVPKKNFGTILVLLGFTNYIFPEVKQRM
jgi:arginine decarboxylase